MPSSGLFLLLPGLHHGGLGDRGTVVLTWGAAEYPSDLEETHGLCASCGRILGTLLRVHAQKEGF